MNIKHVFLLAVSSMSCVTHTIQQIFIENHTKQPISITVKKYYATKPGYIGNTQLYEDNKVIAAGERTSLGAMLTLAGKMDNCVGAIEIKGTIKTLSLEKKLGDILMEQEKNRTKNYTLIIRPTAKGNLSLQGQWDN